jgi:ABC-type antimicrobial peptide transport system permease subunit
VRQLIEAGLLSGLAGVLSVLIAAPQALFYNVMVADTDIPLRVTPTSFLVTVIATLTVGILFALYPAWRAASRPPTISLGRH